MNKDLLLAPCHLVPIEEPKREDYFSKPPTGLDYPSYKMAIKDYKAKTERPEPKFIDIKDSKPIDGQIIIVTDITDQVYPWICTYVQGKFAHPFNDEIRLWADKEDYDKRLEYWADHQTIFDGFKLKEKTDSIEIFSNDKFEIDFYNGRCVNIISSDKAVVCQNKKGWTISQFEAITKLKAKENG